MSDNILIVDDNIKNIEVIGSILIEEKLDFAYATSGREGLDLLRKYAFDLILLDVMMPEMDGFEFIEIVRKFHDYQCMPIIFLTARKDGEDIVKGFEMGAQDYIAKPFNKNELIARIRNMLSLKRCTDKQAKELRGNIEQLGIIHEAAQIGYCVLNSETWDVSFVGFSGLLPHFLEHRIQTLDDMLNFVHPNDRSEVQRQITCDVVKDRGRMDRTVRMKQPDHSGDNWFRIIADGAGIRDNELYVTVQNMTDDMILRQNLERMERMASLGQMASGIAHDFNNILARILASADALDMTGSIPDEKRRYLKIIQDSVKRAAAMITQIRDFSRKTASALTSFSFKKSVEDILPLLHMALPANIRFEYLAAPSLSDTIFADKGKIGQVILNLVVNARDAQPGGGAIVLSLENVHFQNEKVCSICDERLIGDYVSLSVTDSGTGIPAEVLEHIFEPFYTTKPRDKGTGLGLSQVYGIISQVKGHLKVETSVGKGTRFSILLPCVASSITESSSGSDGILIRESNRTVASF